MRRPLTLTLLVVAALLLPAAMAAATLHASNAAVVTPSGKLVPHYGTPTPAVTTPAVTTPAPPSRDREHRRPAHRSGPQTPPERSTHHSGDRSERGGDDS